MNFNIVLQTDKVLLRPLQYEDEQQLHTLAADPDMWQYFSVNLSDAGELKRWIAAAVEERAADKKIPFTIIDRHTGEVAGSMSIGNISVTDLRAEIGWSWLGKKFRGTDVNRHAKFLMLHYLFDHLNFERVEFKTDVLNERAKNGLRKIGATEEGVLRSHMKMWNNRRRDSVYFSIIKKEWEQVKSTLFNDIQL